MAPFAWSGDQKNLPLNTKGSLQEQAKEENQGEQADPGSPKNGC